MEKLPVGRVDSLRYLVPSNQLLDPAGHRVDFAGRPYDIAVSPNGKVLAIRFPFSVDFYSSSGAALGSVPTSKVTFGGLAFSPDGKALAAAAFLDNLAMIAPPANGDLAPSKIALPIGSGPSGVAFDPAGKHVYVALNYSNQVAHIDLATFLVRGVVDVGVAPFGVAVAPSGKRLFVANWGGRRPQPTDATARSGATQTRIDERGIANSGSVSVIDLPSFQVVREIDVGLHPSAVAVSPDGALAAIANANSDSVTLLDAATLNVVDTIAIPAFPSGFKGSSPTALAFGRRGAWLYVACGGINAVAVLRRQGSTYALEGYVPTDWYPVALAVQVVPNGYETVFVANSKGVGGRDSPNLNVYNFRGTISYFTGGKALVDSAKVRSNNMPFAGAALPGDSPADLSTLGIDHVFYIIKENRTYDQVLGDMPKGNGSAEHVNFGRNITPNHHALADQFVLLDNFFTSGTNSADGHQWATQAMATDYVERSYGSRMRSYPFVGDDPMAFASTGFIWTQALAHGKTVRVYGEFSEATATHTWAEYLADAVASSRTITQSFSSNVAALDPYTDPNYPGWSLDIPDTYRARVFLDKLASYVSRGDLPNLNIIWLPTDHTQGATPGAATVAAMVADNDLALGRIVEAISKSPTWPRSAIFVTEDDSANGTDHVDGHRTLCLVAGPYVRRNAVDSTHYNQTSILRTIEELLGLPPMNRFDAAALPMRSIFTSTANLSAYAAQPNQVALDTLNASLFQLQGKERYAAEASMRMDFSKPDAAPEGKLNRILWHAMKGWDTPYPATPRSPDAAREEEDD